MSKNYTVQEVAKKLKVSEGHIYELVKKGDLKKLEGLGRVIRIPREEVQELIGNKQVKYNSEKVDVIDTSLGRVRVIRGKDSYVLLDIATALKLSDSYVIRKQISNNYIERLNIEQCKEFGFLARHFGILLISSEGLKEYSSKTRNKELVEKLMCELNIDQKIEKSTEPKIGLSEKVHIRENSLQVIEQREVLGKHFKIYGTLENPLFLAKDVAEWIEYDLSSINKMLNSVDEDEKLLGTIFRAGQKREVSMLTEDGLYEVLMQSRKPIAKQFKKEVKKILKQIRLTGGYVANAPKFINNYFSNFSIELREEMVNELEVKINQLSIEKEKIDNQLLENIKAIDEIKSTL